MNAIERVRQRLREGEHDPEVQLHELLLDVNEQIVAHMEATGTKRSDLARRLGTSRAFVTKLLDGNENLTLKTLVRVANALEMKTHIQLEPRARSRRRVGVTRRSPETMAVATRTATRARPAAARSHRPRARTATTRGRSPRSDGR